MKIYDITPPMTEQLAVWPGDTPMSREVLLEMQRGDNLTLSTLRATVHLGAHADGPNHYGKDAPGIDQRCAGFLSRSVSGHSRSMRREANASLLQSCRKRFTRRECSSPPGLSRSDNVERGLRRAQLRNSSTTCRDKAS
jgi:hypothetical protein